MNLEHLIDKYQLDPLETNVLNYLLDHIYSLKKIGIRKVADDNNTSTASIIKLAKKLGYEGYADMIYNIVLSSKKVETYDASHLHPKIYAQFETVVLPFHELLTKYREKKIIVAGLGFSQLVANYINESFLIHGLSSISNIHLQLHSKEFKNKVLLVIISQSGETPRFVKIAKNAKQNDIDIISFLGNEHSPIIPYSTLPIVIDQYDKLMHLRHAPNTFFAEAILIFEYLFSHFLNTEKAKK